MHARLIDEQQVAHIESLMQQLHATVALFTPIQLWEKPDVVCDNHWETITRLVGALQSIKLPGKESQDREDEKHDNPELTFAQTSTVLDQNATGAASTENTPVAAESAALSEAPAAPPAPIVPTADLAPVVASPKSATSLVDTPGAEITAKAGPAAAATPSSTSIENSKTSTEAGPFAAPRNFAQKAESVSPTQVTTVLEAAQEDPTAPQQAAPVAEAAKPTASAAVPMPCKQTRRGTLPNTMVGREFQGQVSFSDTAVLAITDVKTSPPLADLGLQFDAETKTLSGVPIKAGDHDIVIIATVDGPVQGVKCIVEWKCTLTVNPDPKSLWKNIDSNSSDRFWKQDTAKDYVPAGRHVLVAASTRGRSHAHVGQFRDDDMLVLHDTRSNWNILAVADGAGSASASRKGSQIAVQTAVNFLRDSLPREFASDLPEIVAAFKEPSTKRKVETILYKTLVTAAHEACREILNFAASVSQPYKNFSTTLILAVHIDTDAGHFVAGFGIGDGGAALLDIESKTVFPLTQPDTGEFAGQTRFLSPAEFEVDPKNPNALSERLRYTVVDQFTAIVAMTDGVTDPKFPTDAAFSNPEIWCKFWKDDLDALVGITERKDGVEDHLLSWLDFWSPGNHDDRTIAILAKRTRPVT